MHLWVKVQYDGFQWDQGNLVHCAKHGVSREEIERVLGRMRFYIPDPYPDEPRMRTVGVTRDRRHVFVVFAFRDVDDKTYVRPLSARYMHDKEIKSYERYIKS